MLRPTRRKDTGGKMDAAEPIHPIPAYHKLAAASFILGWMTFIFPSISIFYLIMGNGGPGFFAEFILR